MELQCHHFLIGVSYDDFTQNYKETYKIENTSLFLFSKMSENTSVHIDPPFVELANYCQIQVGQMQLTTCFL